MKGANIGRISMIVAMVIALVGIVTLGIVAFSTNNEASIGFAIGMSIVLLILSALMALASGVNGMMVNPAGFKNAAIGIGLLALVVLVAYLMADGSDYEQYGSVTEGTAKYVSAALNTFYILFMLTIVSVLYSGVARIFK